jgi:hypothetical protein
MAMTDDERKALEAKGYKFGDAEDFLGLNEEERRMVQEQLDEKRSLSECAAWFRKGIEAKLAETKPTSLSQHDPFDEDNPPNFSREAYEAGYRIGEQILCEQAGHEYEEPRGHSVSDYLGRNFYHREYQTCQRCERQRQKTLFVTNDADEWNEYDWQRGRELTAKRKAEREAKEGEAKSNQ